MPTAGYHHVVDPGQLTQGGSSIGEETVDDDLTYRLERQKENGPHLNHIMETLYPC